MCDVRVMSGQFVVSSGSLVSVDPTLIGVPIVHSIQLTIIGEYIMIVDNVCLGMKYRLCCS